MAEVSLVMKGDAIGEIAVTFSMPDPDAARILRWAAHAYPQGDDSGNTVQAEPAVYLQACAEDMLAKVMSSVIAFEQDQAASAARSSVTQIAASRVT